MPGGVAGDDRRLLEERLQPGVERLLGRGLLDDRLEDQVAVAEQLEGVVEVADA